MGKIEVPYGDETLKATGDFSAFYLLPKKAHPSKDPIAEILKALEKPVSHKGIAEFRNAESIAIVISDETRPVPNSLILNSLLSKLKEQGISGERITLLVGTGMHESKNSSIEDLIGEELASKVGEVVFHDAMDDENLVYLGRTSRGTPIWINKHYLLAEKKIVTGMIEPHQFVGYTGGAKGVAIGLGGAETIEANHSLMLDEKARLGILEGNPVREDIDEMGSVAGIDLLVNVVMDYEKCVVKAVAGDWLEAYKKGVGFARDIAEVKTPFLADVVVASPGGYPRDLNVYQAQKALATAEIVSKPDGVIVLVAECPRGMGDEIFEKTLSSFSSPSEIIDYFKNTGFKMGVHKAYLWAKTLVKHKTILVSDRLTSRDEETLKVDLVSDLETALEKAVRISRGEKVLVLPHASSIVPLIN